MKKCYLKDSNNMYYVNDYPLIFSNDIRKAKTIDSKKHATNIMKWLQNEKGINASVIECKEEKTKKIIELVMKSKNVKQYDFTAFDELYIEFKNGIETVVDFETSTAWWNETLDDIIKRLMKNRPETKQTPFDMVSKDDFINYDIQGFQGLINKTAYILEKTNDYIRILEGNTKARYTKKFFNEKILNVSVIYQD